MSESTAKLHGLIFDSIAEGVFTVDRDFRITSFNREAARITGTPSEEAIGRKCHEVLRASICQSGCALRKTLESGEPLRNIRVDLLNDSMEPVPIRVTTAVLEDETGEMIGGVEIFRDVSELEALRKELHGGQGFADIVGSSTAMQEVFRLIPDTAASEATVLLQGPSGTGKELVAQAIHDLSPRNQKPFIKVNCGALPDTLLESELFGYHKGAFTDAKRDKPGRFAQANSGTILLDEIGDVSQSFQVKLLRVLQDGEVFPLGATSGLELDVRVIAATNRDLVAMVKEGTFREDLLYRLRVIPITLPPLTARRGDVPLLVAHLVQRFAARTGKPIHSVSEEAMQVLEAHDYPGNVRELENVIERAFVFCHGNSIGVEDLPAELTRGDAPAPGAGPPSTPEEPDEPGTPPPRSAEPQSPEALELVDALNAHRWNRTDTAKALGIGRNTLWRRMKKLGLLDH